MAKPKLVHTQSTEDKLAGYDSLLLATHELVNIYWEQTAPLLQRAIDKMNVNELTVENIYNDVLSGKIQCFILKKDEGELPDVKLVVALNLVAYHQFTAMNVVCVGGAALGFFKSKFWDHLCGWMYMNGVRTVEATVAPSMARIISKYGFKEAATLMRLDLGET